VVAIAVVAGFVAWLALRGGSSSSAPPEQSAPNGAAAVTAAKLRNLAASVKHPIFWLGPKPGYTYELTKTPSGKIYVRYLPAGAEIGADKPYLTVATYPFPGAFPAIKKSAAAKGAVSARLAHGGLAILDEGYPESVHLAYPGVDYQVEVYDPTPARAMQLVSAGQLTNFGSLTASPPPPAATTTTASATPTAAGTGPTAASVGDLQSLATKLGHPIYWAGPKRGYTYELTETSTGKVFIRYLPSGVEVGDPKASYLTVATYPFRNAYSALEKAAGGANKIQLARGGIGIVDAGYPKSVHVAYPGVNYQVEVFNPSPAASRKLVASGAIAPVR